MCGNGSTSVTPLINIDDVTTSVLLKLHKHHLQTLHLVSDICLETDVNLQTVLANSYIKHICIKHRVRGREIATLTRNGIHTVQEAINRGGNNTAMMLSVLNLTLVRHIQTLINTFVGTQLPQPTNSAYLFDHNRMNMFNVAQLPSRNIRHMIEPTKVLNNTKLLTTTNDESISIYNNIIKISSIQNKTKML